MEIKTLIEKFDTTIDFWINGLVHYDEDELCLIPDPTNWSVGQVYVHLIEETKFYIEQIETCLTQDLNPTKEMTSEAKKMFRSNSFPNAKIKGAATVLNVPQPKSTAQLKKEFYELKYKLRSLAQEISKHIGNGKVEHPGLGYFNSAEWFQFAEMHLRHHFRQKQRLDIFLKKSN